MRLILVFLFVLLLVGTVVGAVTIPCDSNNDCSYSRQPGVCQEHVCFYESRTSAPSGIDPLDLRKDITWNALFVQEKEGCTDCLRFAPSKPVNPLLQFLYWIVYI